MDAQRHTQAQFQTTSWSLVIGARSSDADLERLLGQYWSPVYAYIRKSGSSHADAADLTQEFVSSIVLERGLLDRAQADRGRFRTLLRAALRNFLVDQHRRATASRRSPKGVRVGIDPIELAQAESNDSPTPDAAFDRIWASRLLARALKQLEEECLGNGLDRHWQVFEAVVVGPAVSGCEAPALSELSRRFGAASPDQVSNMVQTVKRRFRRTLREIVLETVELQTDADAELLELRELLV